LPHYLLAAAIGELVAGYPPDRHFHIAGRSGRADVDRRLAAKIVCDMHGRNRRASADRALRTDRWRAGQDKRALPGKCAGRCEFEKVAQEFLKEAIGNYVEQLCLEPIERGYAGVGEGIPKILTLNQVRIERRE
jgi:hypothetical protein